MDSHMPDRIRVITSDLSETRFRQFHVRNPGHTIQAVFALDPASLTREACIRDQLITPDNTYSPAERASALTHIALWRECAAGASVFHIADDNIQLRADFAAASTALLADIRDWDIVLWAHNRDWPLSFIAAPGLGPVTMRYGPELPNAVMFHDATAAATLAPLISAAGLGCYSLSPAGATRLLAACLPLGAMPADLAADSLNAWANTALDAELSRHYRHLNAFVAIPPLALGLGALAGAGKTLIFCTAFARQAADWQTRHEPWLRAIHASALPQDQILIVDDGSTTLPNWPGLTIVSDATHPSPAATPVPGGTLLYHFAENLGRRTILDFPGWHRSFAFAAQYARAHGFHRVIHIESDAYLITPRLQHYLAALEDGWVAMHCPAHNFPEIAINAAAGAGVATLARWADIPWPEGNNSAVEARMPFTRIAHEFRGDRYGEFRQDIPRDADFSTQTHLGRAPSFYWWLSPEQAI